MKTLFFLFPFITLFFVSACSDDTGYSLTNNPINEEDPSSINRNFDTRLTNKLRIKGVVCLGGEQTDVEGQTYTCTGGDYLVTVDDVNYCTPEGCTDVFVSPIIASLLATGDDGSGSNYFDIVPSIEVSEHVEDILEDVYVRSRANENIVLFK